LKTFGGWIQKPEEEIYIGDEEAAVHGSISRKQSTILITTIIYVRVYVLTAASVKMTAV
jgi:hypothetical protein